MTRATAGEHPAGRVAAAERAIKPRAAQLLHTRASGATRKYGASGRLRHQTQPRRNRLGPVEQVGNQIQIVRQPNSAAARESAYGTTRTSQRVGAISVIEGISEVKYLLRAFRMLTRLVIAPVFNPNARSKIEDRDNDPIASETH